MANIKLNDLSKMNLSGVDLFDDSESFLTELNDENEQINIVGGSCKFLTFGQQTPPPWTCPQVCCHDSEQSIQ
ncbi:hypothetical protein [Calothrix sp. PCC 6303]|jgi:hypothetical protein|uniref:hypothetical protein n=1 Tax=Calothrix sp. PCC 6303 TaxID=1170562 RepID=UPI0002A02172|nr:hypothetical protein [Calothrix sp. PCC 6303]AFZ01490.1 hypothetical protein Cal6303_2498 [Calothrix sp. PCC 6303]